jgi:putative pyruvate formate lyase activating enzyme
LYMLIVQLLESILPILYIISMDIKNFPFIVMTSHDCIHDIRAIFRYNRIVMERNAGTFAPGYLVLLESGELQRRIDVLNEILHSCELCPRKCRINRSAGERGYCRAGNVLEISSYGPHFGEEEPLVGSGGVGGLLRISDSGGSGTIFLTHCNLRCVYCQNYDISHLGYGSRATTQDAAGMMLALQDKGCHNINFVTPTHFTPQLISALKTAAVQGLRLPVVWNCSGYENVEIIRLLDDIVDIYMPDFKYGTNERAKQYSNAADYFERCTESLLEMHRQVGDLMMDERGVARRGVLIRHLVLPNNLAGSEHVLDFIAKELSVDSYVNIMSQYRPEGEAYRYAGLDRYPTGNEFHRVIDLAKKLGLTRGLQDKHIRRL